jgi:hypothetical protein
MQTRMTPGAPHFGEIEADMVRQTQALWYRNMGSSHSYYHEEYTVCPYVTVSTTHGTWTTFSIQQVTYSISCDYSIPWYMQTGATKIRARILWTANNVNTTPVHLRMETSGLITASSTVYSTASEAHAVQSTFLTPKGQWRSVQQYCMFADVIATPDIPADRCINLKFQATMYATEGNNPDQVGNYAPKVYIIGAQIHDMFPGPSL